MAPRPVSAFIDYSGTPSLKVRKLVATLLGIPALAWFLGVIEFINGISDGISSTLEGIGDFLRFDVVGGIVRFGQRAITQAWVTNVDYLQGSIGPLALPVAIVEVALLMLVVFWIAERTIGALLGGG